LQPDENNFCTEGSLSGRPVIYSNLKAIRKEVAEIELARY